MSLACPSCRAPLDDFRPDLRLCPSCGDDLWKDRPGDYVRAGLNLRTVAREQRRLLLFILAQLGLYLTMAVSPRGGEQIMLLLGPLILVALNIIILICSLRLLAAVGIGLGWRIIAAVLLFAPCISLLIMLGVNQRATRALRKAGLKVGLLGVKDVDVVRILSAYRCHICGYDLHGNVSGRCPECGAPVPGAEPVGAATQQPGA